MFEFNFEKKENYKGIEKDIKDYNTKDNLPIIAKIGLSSLLGSVLALCLINMYNITNLFVISGSIILFSVVSGSTIELTKKFINDYKKNNAIINLDTISDSCKKNNILVDAENISESIIIKQSNRELNVFNDDGKIDNNEVIVDDNYYLFLDNSNNLNGILERKITENKNGEKENSNLYYLLEEDDIKSLENRTKLVKKLVKKR